MQLLERKAYESPKVEVFVLRNALNILENLSLEGDILDPQDGGEIGLGDLTSPW